MTMEAFDPEWFDQVVTFYAAGAGASGQVRAGPVLDAGAGVSMAARVEPSRNQFMRSEGHNIPEGTSLYNVFTAADPGTAVDRVVTWGARTFVAQGHARDVSDGSGVLFRTECLDVT